MIDHDKDFGFLEFAGQRYHYSRAYAGMRNPGLGWKRVVYCVGAPLLPPFLYYRMAKNLSRAPRLRRAFVRSTPLIAAYSRDLGPRRGSRLRRRRRRQPAEGALMPGFVGIDATLWRNRRGYGRFARNAVAALVAADPTVRYRLYVDPRQRRSSPSRGRSCGACASSAARTSRQRTARAVASATWSASPGPSAPTRRTRFS